MPIYVDKLFDYGSQARKQQTSIWCHLYPEDPTDQAQVEELHVFAQSIGLQESWFQDRLHFPHFDLTSRKRKAAIAAGALEDNDHKVLREQIRKRREKEQNNANHP